MIDRIGKWPHIPLDEHLKGATHIRIVCRCSHQGIMLTAELYRLLPRAVTCSDFHERLRCTHCNLKGWATIRAAGR
uniref:hypothetical protein n=1 Tax=uncultured Sphingomonas sp. TaxID=158754 RepID=UPI0035C9AE95